MSLECTDLQVDGKSIGRRPGMQSRRNLTWAHAASLITHYPVAALPRKKACRSVGTSGRGVEAPKDRSALVSVSASETLTVVKNNRFRT